MRVKYISHLFSYYTITVCSCTSPAQYKAAHFLPFRKRAARYFIFCSYFLFCDAEVLVALVLYGLFEGCLVNGDCKVTVTAVPLDLQAIALDEFFDDVLGDISGLKGIKLEELLRDRLAMAACKAAVKGGMSLTEGEVKTLLADMDGNAGLKCPHGRPAVVRLTKYEIEKMFKRIV